MDRTLSWAEVQRTHRTRRGIYQRGGHLVSLLTDFGRHTPCYPDSWSDSLEEIHYTGEGRHGDQRLTPGNRALLAAIESGHAVPLFNKLAAGRWQHMGFWRVTQARYLFDEQAERMLWRFTLRKVAPLVDEGSKTEHRAQAAKLVRTNPGNKQNMPSRRATPSAFRSKRSKGKR